MNMREISKELYEIMFANNLLAMQKYEMIKTLLDECYQAGYCAGYCDGMKDSDELYFNLFTDEDFTITEEW